MVDFIKFKELFESWSNRKDIDEDLFQYELKSLNYDNGRVLFDENLIPRTKIYLMSDYIDNQELMIMEYDYNYRVSDIQYLYVRSSDLLYKRIACNWNNNDWQVIEDEDIPELLGKELVLLVCYIFNDSWSSDLKESNILSFDKIYEISNDEYYDI